MRVITPLLQDADHPWWDNIETPFTQETRDDILLRALVRSYSELHSHLDDDRESWRWGNLHHVTLTSRIISQEGLMSLGNVTGLSINRGRYPLAGGLATLNTTFYDIVSSQFDTSQGIILAPAYRMIIDLSDFSNSRAIQATGQSGHPASDNYDDMIALWRAGEYHNMRWGGEIVDRAKKQLDLRPAPTYTPGDGAASRGQEG
jgi:penicillin amidase